MLKAARGFKQFSLKQRGKLDANAGLARACADMACADIFRAPVPSPRSAEEADQLPEIPRQQSLNVKISQHSPGRKELFFREKKGIDPFSLLIHSKERGIREIFRIDRNSLVQSQATLALQAAQGPPPRQSHSVFR